VSTPDTSVRLTFPARAEYLILARLALAGIARATRIDDETLADLKLAVTEACGNVVRHAYPGPGEEGRVCVTFRADDGLIEILVEDEGVGLADDGGASDDEGRTNGESGMGLAIISAIADELSVRRAGPQGGTVLMLRKTISS
jgi:serine/threonine-protein kinase RsbW